MKLNRLIAILSLILAVLFLLNACTPSGPVETPDNTQNESEQPKPDPDPEPEPTLSLAELYPDALTFDDLETTKTAVRYHDWNINSLNPDYPIHALVIYVQFTDGYEPDKALIQDRFEGEYDYDNCVRSLKSFYKYSFYDQVSFDFTYYYYQSPLTCAEAYHLVHDENEEGLSYWNNYLYDIFDEVKGDPENGIEPGTKFEDLPEDFECPVCGVGAELFSEE